MVLDQDISRRRVATVFERDDISEFARATHDRLRQAIDQLGRTVVWISWISQARTQADSVDDRADVLSAAVDRVRCV